MNIQSVFIFFVLLIIARANPIMVDEGTTAEKLSENCLIFINKKVLNVSCKVDYKIVDRSSPKLHVHVPVYFTVAQYQKIEKTRKFMDAKIECEGISYSPLSVFSSEVDEKGRPFPDETGPDSKVEVGCEFLIKTPKSDKFTLLVTYTQSLINGKAYYLPLFEKGSTPGNMTDFKVTFFTASGSKLNLATQHIGRPEIMQRRISVCPKDRELIAVEISDDKTVEETSEK
jgi:hypothetical protein